MSYWSKKEQMPVMPQEVTVPVPEQDITNGETVSAWAPRGRHMVPQQDQALETIRSAESILINYREEMKALNDKLDNLRLELEIQKSRNTDLELTLAQARNDAATDRAARDEAERNLHYCHGALSAIISVGEDYRAHGPVPLPRKRKEKAAGSPPVRQNGDHGVIPPQTETLASEAPKPEGTDGQA